MDICIATTTSYPNPSVRAKLALKMVKEAVTHGINVVVVDGGSAPEFRRNCLQLQAFIGDQEESGMGPGRRQCIRQASKMVGPTGAVLWMEPEKWPLISQVFLLEATMEETGADIVVPTRKSMSFYPPIQRAAERLGNMYFAKATGHELDVWAGPRLIGPKAMPYFLDYKGEWEYGDNWDSIFVPVVQAIAAGLKVIGCEVDYIHPAEQTADEGTDPEMDLKRLVQLQTLVPAIYAESRKLGLLK